MRSRRYALLALLAALLAGGLWYARRASTPGDAGVVIRGGDGGRLPRADAEAEGFDGPALQSAAELARLQHSRALLVMRHEHLLLEVYGAGADADTLLEGGALGEALVALAAGVAHAQNAMPVSTASPFAANQVVAAIARAGGMNYAHFLSRNLWQPLDAAPARLAAGTSPGTAVSARAVDWLRVAGLLLHDGRFEGTQVVPPGWVAQLHHSAAGGDDRRGWGIWLAGAASGREGFASDDVYFLRGSGATRLWLVPRLDLAILQSADQPTASPGDDTRLPNVVIRALRDRPASGGVSLNDLVPGH